MKALLESRIHFPWQLTLEDTCQVSKLVKPVSNVASWVFPKIMVSPKWMVYIWFIMENPIKMGWFGGKPTIFGNIQLCCHTFLHIQSLWNRKNFVLLSNFARKMWTHHGISWILPSHWRSTLGHPQKPDVEHTWPSLDSICLEWYVAAL